MSEMSSGELLESVVERLEQNKLVVNINTASEAELDGLWGIGESRAKAIVENRPYASVDELVSKARIPSNVMEKIRDQVTVN